MTKRYLFYMNQVRNCGLVALLTLGCSCLNAQISITSNLTANALINRLAGSGIVYLNPTLTCPNNASGKFDNGNLSSIAIDSGIVLTTGRAITNMSSIGVNGASSAFASVNNNTNGGDANLATAAGTTNSNIHDLCKLEFDFIPTGDTIQFRYRFGSEEYPTYNCTDYNDIFAFFISGPGYAIPTNVALVPGTTIPVSINSINNGTVSGSGGGVLSNCTSLGPGSPFTSLYVNNNTSTTITYNGLTALLTAKAAVTPCSTYHMKFAIADVNDHIYDSGVFLEAGSFSSDIASVTSVISSNSLGGTVAYAIEGCSPAVITISRPQPKSYPQIVTYTLSGSATNGADITTLSGTTTIPAMGTSTTITVNALSDGLIEGTENLVLSINGALCGNTVTETLTIQIQDRPSFIKPLSDTICLGQSIPLNALPSPANPNLTFNWSPASGLNTTTGNSVMASPLVTTTYTITSAYPGCPSVDSTCTVSVENLPLINLTASSISCNGMANGSILVSGSVGNGPPSLQLNPGGATANSLPFTFSGLTAGSYNVTVSSATGCVSNASAIISMPVILSWTSVQSTNPSCSGFSNGQLQVIAAGGTGAIAYSLSPGGLTNSSGNFPGLTAGAYTITATDLNGCSISTFINLTVSNSMVWTTATATNIAPCFGLSNGSIQVAVSGGTAPLTYSLLPGAVNNTSGLFNGLSQGIYSITATDANGCSIITTFSITQPAQVQITNVSAFPLSCFGAANGSIQLNAAGGTGSLQYTLLPSTISTSGSFTNLSAGTYTVKVSDANGCTQTTTALISSPPLLQFTSFVTAPVDCFGNQTGQVNVAAQGGTSGLTYTLLSAGISNNTGVFASLPAGSYTVMVTDANGCSMSSSTTLSQPPQIVQGPPLISMVTCNGISNGQIQLAISGGSGNFIYEMQPGTVLNNTGNFSSLNAGVYTITATDVMGCSIATFVTISQPAPLVFANASITQPLCANVNNGVIGITGGGGTPAYQYAINGGAYSANNLFSALAAGTYVIQLKDNVSCLHDTTIILASASDPYFTNIVTTDVLCKYDATGVISLNSAGGTAPYSYTINGISSGSLSTFNGLSASVYTIVSTDNFGCLIDTVLTLSEPVMPLSFNSVAIQHVPCYGNPSGNLFVTATGGSAPYQYSINGLPYQLNPFFGNLSAATYSILIKDNHGCITDTVVQVKQPPSPLTLSVKKIKEISCVGLQDAEINVAILGGVKPFSLTLNGTAMGSDTVFANLNIGNYQIIVTDSNGCLATLNVNIDIPTRTPYIIIDRFTENTCKGQQIGMIDWHGINGFPPYRFTINGMFLDSVSEANNLASASYLIELIDTLGCKADTTIVIEETSTLDISVIATSATCTGDGHDGKATAVAVGGQQPYMYSWSGTVSGTEAVTDLSFGEQFVVVSDGEQCKDTAFFTIQYEPCCELYLPNAFSPNEDGHNDYFRIIPYGILDVKSFEIFDRWGKRIFVSNHIGGEWDGKTESVECEMGTYYYLIKYYCQLSKQQQIKYGDLILLR